MYAAMIRPQQKRARQHQALVSAVQVGDEVMTTAGIFGTVTAVEGDVISIEIAPGTVMRVARAAIGRRMSAELDEYDAGESFDDVDDEIGDSVADEATPSPGETNGEGSTLTQAPEPPTPTSPSSPAAETPPTPPVTPPPAPPGSGSGPGEPV
jgi:preprotein translocase subunit YajC